MTDPTSSPNSKRDLPAEAIAERLPPGRCEVRAVDGRFALLLVWIEGEAPAVAVRLSGDQCRELGVLLGQAAERIP